MTPNQHYNLVITALEFDIEKRGIANMALLIERADSGEEGVVLSHGGLGFRRVKGRLSVLGKRGGYPQWCPKKFDPHSVIPLDPNTIGTFANMYYKNLRNRQGLLTSDEVLFTDTRPSQPIPKTLNHQTSPRFNSRTHYSAMTNSNTPPPPLALTLVKKLYAVHNINSLVPEKLYLQESNYSTWSYFFKGHCSNFNVLNHIDGSTSTCDPPIDEWITADSIVKSWIFLTLSPTLRKRMISTNPASAKAAWDTIETIFQENKRTRIVALKGELRIIQIGDDTPDAYFSKIDSIITLFTDLGLTMDDDYIVTYAINDLSEKYGSLAQIIAHKDPYPDIATVRTMVTTEEMCLWSKQPILSTSTTLSSP
ncbi:hybrid signal transduction histidine kinase M [Tanacetum coccineum]